MLNNDLSNVAELMKMRAGFQELLPEVREPFVRRLED